MCHVLVIEDDYFTAVETTEMLRTAGAASVDCTAFEEDAVQLADVRRPDLIIADVHISEGSGPRAVARIVERLGPITTAFVTGSPELAPTETHVIAIVGKTAMPCDPKPLFRRWLTAVSEIAPIRA